MADEDRAYVAWIRTRPCSVAGCASTGIDAHHKTGAGMALRHHDRSSIPLCRAHHVELHTFSGYFAGWSRWARDDFQDTHIARCQREHQSHDACDY